HLVRRARRWHRRLGLKRAVRAHARALAGDARSLDHLGRPQGRARDPVLPYGEAVQSGAAAPERIHGRLLPAQDQSRFGRLDPRGRAVRLTLTAAAPPPFSQAWIALVI